MRNTILHILLIFLLTSCLSKGKKNVKVPPYEIDVTSTKEGLKTHSYTFTSNTESKDYYSIEPRISGYLSSKNYQDGSIVEKGQLLFTIDPKPYEIALSESVANLSSAKSSLTNARSSYDRIKPLAEMNAMSQSDLDNSLATLEAAEAQYNLMEQELANARLNLSYTKLHSPSRGVVSSTSAVVGDYVGVGTSFSTLASVSYSDTIAVNLSLPMKKYLEILNSNSDYNSSIVLSNITMILSDNSIYPYEGIYNYTLTDVDKDSDAIVFQVLFPNANFYLKPGQFVRVKADIGRPFSMLTIPQKSVTQSQNVFSVWEISPDSIARRKEVRIVGTHGDDYIISKGLSKGDIVAVNGFFKLRDGMRVSPQYSKE